MIDPMVRHPGLAASCLAPLLLLLLLLPWGGLGAQEPSGLEGALDLLQAGDLAAAAGQLEPLLTEPDTPRPVLALLMRLRAALGRPSPGLPADPGPPVAGEEATLRLARAEAELLARHPRQALDALAPLLSAAPTEVPVRVRRGAGRAALLAGLFDEAVGWLDGAVGGEAALALSLAQALYRQGDAPRALAELRPFVDRFLNLPDGVADAPATGAPLGVQVDLLLDYGRIATASGAAELALPALQRAARLTPERAQIWQALGQALLIVGRREEGAQALGRFREISAAAEPEPVDMARLAARAEADRRGAEKVEHALGLARGGDAAGAAVFLEREIAADPALLEPRLLLISLLLNLRRPDEAWQVADAAVAAFPDEVETLYHRGIVALVRRDLPRAEADFESTLERAPRHVLALNNLAVVLLQQGRFVEGRRLLERVLEIDPDNELARQNLARIRPALPAARP